jgi:hypothetical protein
MKKPLQYCKEAAQIINSRPLTGGPWAKSDPLSPEDLMLGRAKVGIPMVHFKTGQQLVKRFRIVQHAKEEFWDRWVKEVFPSLLRQQKWHKYKRDAKVEDCPQEGRNRCSPNIQVRQNCERAPRDRREGESCGCGMQSALGI